MPITGSRSMRTGALELTLKRLASRLSVIRGLGPEDTLRLGCGAGAANVTRHGLGNVEPGLVERLADEVEVNEL